MLLYQRIIPRFGLALVACALLSSPAWSQQDDNSSQTSQTQSDNTVEGNVVSSGRSTFVVQSSDNQYHVFTWDEGASKPRGVVVGAHVRVASDAGDEAGARNATNVTVLDQAQSGSTSSSGTSGSSSTSASTHDAAPVPPSVRNVERQIERDARRWRMGVRAGVGLDPELVMFGVHSQIGPVFSRNVFFRPNADFEWGEVTDMVALNLEAVYRMPRMNRSSAWAPYLGGGPSLNFIHQGFNNQNGQGRNISFGNFDYETGFNILAGVQNRHGTFFEIKTSLYSQPAPVLRLIIGRNF